MRSYTFSFILIAVFMLQGCILFKQRSMPEIIFKSEEEKKQAWNRHQQQIQSVTAWQATGRAGIRTTHDAVTADINWQQNNADYALTLRNLLGQLVMKLSGQPGTSVLLTPGHKPVTGYSGTYLVFNATGWDIPFDALSYWMRGISLPETPAVIHLNDQGRLAMLEQSGWKISYSQYIFSGKYVLPSRIRLIHNDANIILSLLWNNIQ